MIYSACDQPPTRFDVFRLLHGGIKQKQTGRGLMASYNIVVR